MSNRIWILGLATLFWLIETRYFGWNLTPQSEAELICDGIVLLIAALSLVTTERTAKNG